MKLWAHDLAKTNPFPDTPLGIHWADHKHSTYLYDGNYQVGRVYYFLTKWMAESYWGRLDQDNEVVEFETEEEARAYLQTTYRFER